MYTTGHCLSIFRMMHWMRCHCSLHKKRRNARTTSGEPSEGLFVFPGLPERIGHFSFLTQNSTGITLAIRLSRAYPQPIWVTETFRLFAVAMMQTECVTVQPG